MTDNPCANDHYTRTSLVQGAILNHGRKEYACSVCSAQFIFFPGTMLNGDTIDNFKTYERVNGYATLVHLREVEKFQKLAPLRTAIEKRQCRIAIRSRYKESEKKRIADAKRRITCEKNRGEKNREPNTAHVSKRADKLPVISGYREWPPRVTVHTPYEYEGIRQHEGSYSYEFDSRW